MTDKVMCPYCGSEMKIDRQDDGYVFGAAYYVCQECGSTSPTANTDAAALAAARARYLPPNRPLTLAEVTQLDTDEDGDAPCWIEDRVFSLSAKYVSTNPDDLVDYGRDYRVWLRKPTQAEMDAAGWGG